MAKGWWNESQPHAMASKGQKVRPNMTKITTGLANKTAMKNRVSDSIQNDMHGLDKLLRKASSSRHHDDVVKLLTQAEKIYDKLAEKVRLHKEKYGELDWWVSQTWHGHENFNNNGTVKRLMSNLKNAEEKDMKKKQMALWETIRLPSESKDPDKKLSEQERKKAVDDAYKKALKKHEMIK